MKVLLNFYKSLPYMVYLRYIWTLLTYLSFDCSYCELEKMINIVMQDTYVFKKVN
jgi:hypothetical protein